MTFVFICSVLLSIIPIGLIAYWFYQKDTIKEPKKLLKQLFLSGILSGIFVLIISIVGVILFPKITILSNIDNLFTLLFYAYIFIGLVEEMSKFFMIYKGGYNNEYFDQSYDIVLYSVYVSMGFALFENIIYLYSYPNFQTAITRSLTAVPAHVCFQVIMGYFLYLSKQKDNKKNIIKSIAYPILIHGTYDFFIFYGTYDFLLIDLIFLILICIDANTRIKKLIEIDKHNLENVVCPNCHNIIKYNYCPNCGHKK